MANEEMTMEYSESPLNYLGNRRQSAAFILRTLAHGKKYQTFYDPFCGSGSFTYAALDLNLAKHYVMGDSYAPLIDLLQSIAYRPQQLVNSYELHYQQILQQKTYAKQVEYYNQIKNIFHQSSQTGDFLFLNNLAQHHLPVIDHNYYCSELNASLLEKPLSSSRLYAASHLLRRVSTMKTGPFENMLADATASDLVILDPPYPDLPQDVPIYHRLVSTDGLHEALMQTLEKLNQKGVAFILFYGTLGINRKYLLDTQRLRLQHLTWLSPAHNPLFGEYLEHCYLSQNLAFSADDLCQLPALPYEQALQKSSTELAASIKLRQKNVHQKTASRSLWLEDRQVGFSSREHDVIRLLKQGFSAKQTAAHLTLSVRTVESYLEHIKNKLGCRTKLQLISKLSTFNEQES